MMALLFVRGFFVRDAIAVKLSDHAMFPLCWFALSWHRNRRTKRGLCSRCGYDIRACSDRCSECGTPIELPLAASRAKRC